ncbi:2-ketoisovalerate ferredoxin oxidoreductase [bacterium F16]|nr:2-ketoisovalerate ferredoxin oxidoreductase [bacterium F16]
MNNVKHQKADVYYDEFERKGVGQTSHHYCPGCGHGTVHNLIAEAIDDFNIQDRTIFCSPVGCSVFAYYYFKMGNVQCAHGRAPAVASAIRRTHEDAIIISYQGDGDLAGIGMSQIIHAANRGENITVFFINNAIYGMTGGQMAPTTLLHQRTVTTPEGRSENDGLPTRMCELISTMEAPVLVERVSLEDPKHVMKARRSIRKGLQNQIEGKGFSFIEILSPCPVGWKMSPVESRTWIGDVMSKVFPVQVFKDLGKEVEPRSFKKKHVSNDQVLEYLQVNEETASGRHEAVLADQHIKIAGFGGQGVLSAGILLANCAIAEGLKTTWLPSYGPEMRGGTANASINISEHEIGSPIVSFPNILIALNLPSLDAFESKVHKDGIIFVNSSLITRNVERDDVWTIYVPASDMAQKIGIPAVLNVIVLAIYASITGAFSIETMRRMIPETLKKKTAVEANMKAIEVGLAFYENEVKPVQEKWLP